MSKAFAAGLLAFALLARPCAHAQRLTIPELRGKTLAGDAIALPQDLRGHTAVLIVGFSKAASGQAAAWGKRLGSSQAALPDLTYFELPMLESVPRLLRALVLREIKASVSPAGQAHFLPVFDHEAEWKTAAAFNDPDDAYVLIVDSTGTVTARVHGPLTDASYTRFLGVLPTRRDK